MIIEPGDLILGDSDGVLSVPIDDLEGILAAAQAKRAAETKQMTMIMDGTIDRSWVDKALAVTNCALPSQ